VRLGAEEVLSSVVGLARLSLTILFVTASAEISELVVFGTVSGAVSGLIVSLVLRLGAEEVFSSVVGLAGLSLATLFVTASAEISELVVLGTVSRTASGLIVSLVFSGRVVDRLSERLEGDGSVGLGAEEVLSSLIWMAGLSLATLFLAASAKISELVVLGIGSRTVSGLIVSFVFSGRVVDRLSERLDEGGDDEDGVIWLAAAGTMFSGSESVGRLWE
jgi:hypothetical protein